MSSNVVKAITEIVLGMSILVSTASANVVLSGTRLVYSANDNEITVQSKNPSGTPVLAQVWIDSGDQSERAEQSRAPFLVVPAMIRLEANGGQSFRVIHLADEQVLPQNQESVFYFNILDVPPKPTDLNQAAYMQFAYRTRIKLFYRPTGLQGSPAASASQLQWSLQQDSTGQVSVQVNNPSAFHVSLSDVAVTANGVTYLADVDMVAPYSVRQFPVKKLNTLPASFTLKYQWINDYGALISNESKAAF